MRRLFWFLLLFVPALTFASELTKDQAVVLAEKFIVENGYTDASTNLIKINLDYESIEWDSDREKLLKRRFNSLVKKAIGVKVGRKGRNAGWSVAFDNVGVGQKSTCRVVTMDVNGSDIRLEHVAGVREYFVGF